MFYFYEVVLVDVIKVVQRYVSGRTAINRLISQLENMRKLIAWTNQELHKKKINAQSGIYFCGIFPIGKQILPIEMRVQILLINAVKEYILAYWLHSMRGITMFYDL